MLRVTYNVLRLKAPVPVSFFSIADRVFKGILGAGLFLSSTSMLLAEEIPVYGYEIVNSYPHDPKAFTQGLIFSQGHLYESVGNYGHSSIRKVDLESGKILKIRRNDASIFAEGLTDYQQQLIQLSWKDGSAFVYDKDTFKLIRTFDYRGEGWGLTEYRNQLIMSDGSSVLRFLDPETFKEMRRISVTRFGRPVKRLNELEMVKDTIFANVWLTDHIVIISPDSGHVIGVIDLTGLLERNSAIARADILNGIAYDAKGERLFVTGKFWPKLFEIKIIKRDSL